MTPMVPPWALLVLVTWKRPLGHAAITTTATAITAGCGLKNKCLQKVTCLCLYINIRCQRGESQNITQ